MLHRRRSLKYHRVHVPTRESQLSAHLKRTDISELLARTIPTSRFDSLGLASRFSFEGALENIGLPGTNKTPEVELVDLLNNAAEIEHGLMLQYLYATYSLTNLMIAGILRTIAIEEMGHFISVQNLLMACGAKPYLGISDWTSQTLFQPFTFKLEPASVGSLAKYTVAEMPDPARVPPSIEPDLPELIAQADAAAGSPVEAHRVGLLYAKIYWLLRRSDDPLPDPNDEPWLGFPVAEMAANEELAGRHVGDEFLMDAQDVNAQPEHWRGNYTSVIVEPISGRDAALRAIAKISAQGEGFGDTPEGHFERFVEVWRLAKTSQNLARSMPVNPFYSSSGGGSPAIGEEITSSAGRQFARMGDELYEVVLLCTAANLLLPSGTAPAIRRKPAKASVIAMRDCLSAVAHALSTIPMHDADEMEKVCGLPFLVTPVDVAPNLKAVIDRAHEVVGGLQATVNEIKQENAKPELVAIADNVGTTIGEEVLPRLDSLPL